MSAVRRGGDGRPVSVGHLLSSMARRGGIVAGIALMAATALVLPAGHEPGSPCEGAAGPSVPATVGTSVAVTAGDEPVVDATGRSWAPSDGFSGGEVVDLGDSIARTASPQLYRTAREGVDRYSRLVERPGTYVVDLFVAVPPGTDVDERVVDVVANGREVATNQDPVADAGAGNAAHIMFAVPVSGSCLDLHLIPVRGRTIVSAIEIGFLSPDLTNRQHWSDEFDGPSGAPPDPHTWGHEVGGGGWGNKEMQVHTSDTANARLDGMGHLAVIAREHAGPTPGSPPTYTSARLLTKDKVSFEYGRISVVARVPSGTGLWPGVWALGTDIDEAGFPGSGEIDILESPGEAGAVMGHIHGPDSELGTFSAGKGIDTGIVGRFAEYSVLWTPIGLQFTVEGEPYFVAAPADLAPTSEWVFDKPYYLLITFSVGGTLPGPPDATTPFPAELLVDRIGVTSW